MSQYLTPLTIYALGEQAVSIAFDNRIDPELAGFIRGFDNELRTAPFPGFVTTVIAYATLTVYYNIEQVARSGMAGQSCFEKVSGYLQSLKGSGNSLKSQKSEPIQVPVCYGSELGPDLSALAKQKKMGERSIIELHSSAIYTVYMIGFVPGFAYLGGMDPLLATPRKSQPRAKVPSGSVGIAGLQTGIYPLTTPGGWQLIGRTPLRLFDPTCAQPSFFQAGDLLKFYPINAEEFDHLLDS